MTALFFCCVLLYCVVSAQAVPSLHLMLYSLLAPGLALLLRACIVGSR
jgi:hypothetical protein